MMDNRDAFDAVLVIAFGGPERPEDVRPFLMKVSGGRIPASRLDAVAAHYGLFGGKSPVNELTSRQATALATELKGRNSPLPVYVGMRNWHPLLADTVRQMALDGVRRTVGVIMSVYQSRSSWEQYQIDVANAIAEAGVKLDISYTPPLFDAPGYVQAVSKRAVQSLGQIPAADRDTAHILFTAHSLPYSDPQIDIYVNQVHRSTEMVAKALNHKNWGLAYQSRSGRPQDPWLEPDVNVVLRDLGGRGVKYVIVVPIGFVCDNIEVLYDLDIQAKETAKEAGIGLLRSKTVNDDHGFIDALANLATRIIEDS